MKSGIKSLIIFGMLAVLIAMTIVILIPKNCSIARMEGFQDQAIQPFATECPSGTRTVTDSQGNTSCCDGQVTGSKCEGKLVCTFSSSLSSKVPFCSVPTNQMKIKGENICAESSSTRGSSVRIQPCTFQNSAQSFQMKPNRTIVSKQTGMCVDAAGGSMKSGTPIILWSCHGGINQKWVQLGNQIASGSDISKCITRKGASIQLDACSSKQNPNQEWELTK
jgi:hypothetical protein